MNMMLARTPGHSPRWREFEAKLEAEMRAKAKAEREAAELAEMAAKVQAAMDEPEPPVLRPTGAQILYDVSIEHGVSITDIKSARRQQHVVRARHKAMYRLATETLMSYPAIGRFLGGRDHTTVLHGYRAHMKRTGLDGNRPEKQEPVSGFWTPEREQQLIEMIDRGELRESIAEKLGVTRSQIASKLTALGRGPSSFNRWWTPEIVDRAKALRDQGMPMSEIAVEIGAPSADAVRSKLRKMAAREART